jgi:hypothetical protein
MRQLQLPKMSTLADELLNDFEDSGSEGEQVEDEEASAGAQNGMELDGDEEDVDEEMGEVEDEEEAKAKVEKMQLGHVNDVRSVAGLMKILEPVLEVSPQSPLRLHVYKIGLTISRKLNISSRCPPLRTLARLKIIPNTTFSRSPIHSLRQLIMR